MPVQVTMPQLGESVVEGTLTKWLKSVGDQVQEFEALAEINTDKVDTEIPSPAAGTLAQILVQEGSVVQAGKVLAVIETTGEPHPVGIQPAPTAAQSKELVVPAQAVPAVAQPIRVAGRDRKLGFISPVVARMASQHGIDLYQIPGTGLSGRITKNDVLHYLESHPPTLPLPEQQANVSVPLPLPAREAVRTPVQPSPTALPGDEVLALSPVRRLIAEHMVFSERISPHVTTVMEAELSKVITHRQANKDAFSRDGVNLTYTAYFVAAAVTALKAFPVVNSSWSEPGVVVHRQINVGLATSLGEEGLIVPVIKNADGFSLLGLARVINDLSTRARLKKLNPDEVKGGTFTITNHGISGSLFATPIINQPQCAILGVGLVQKRVVVIEDAIAIRPMAYLSLTFDHRILDGAVADNFLGNVVETLVNWA